jgi:hypothetical protein
MAHPALSKDTDKSERVTALKTSAPNSVLSPVASVLKAAPGTGSTQPYPGPTVPVSPPTTGEPVTAQPGATNIVPFLVLGIALYFFMK